EHLIGSGDDHIHRAVLGARGVPEEPHERVQPVARPQAHLHVARLAEDALGREAAAAHVLRVYRGVLAQKEAHEIHSVSIDATLTAASASSCIGLIWLASSSASRVRNGISVQPRMTPSTPLDRRSATADRAMAADAASSRPSITWKIAASRAALAPVSAISHAIPSCVSGRV